MFCDFFCTCFACINLSCGITVYNNNNNNNNVPRTHVARAVEGLLLLLLLLSPCTDRERSRYDVSMT